MRSQLNNASQEITSTPKVEVQVPAQSISPKPRQRVWLALIAIAVATVIAYSPVLFDFFAGDDFVHLTWLRYAVNEPHLIWKNFYSSWLDGTTTKFYRPLISIFMVTDYLVWRTNGLGFHLTNLAFHLCSTFLLFGVVRSAQQQLGGGKQNMPALVSAAIFSLYPLHPEAVSWITGRVDTIVTTFCLASVFTYLKWKESTKPRWLALSLATMGLGLLSKEMAITIPCVIALFEILSPKRNLKSLVLTAPYWVVLAAYFGLRRLALGTFVGGYDDSLLFIANIKEFLLNWLHALRMLVVPINKELIGSHNVLTKAWELLCISAAVLGTIRFWRQRECRLPMLFAAGWLALSLLPVYKLFAIADDLQGSRLAYLATVPLSVLFGFALTYSRAALPVAFCVLATILLWMNNQPWREAGLQANAIRASLQEIYNHQKGDPQTLLIGMPDQYKGAYISRNALWGMTKFPQLKGDIWNCLMLNQFEPVHPFGFLKPSLLAARDNIKIYRWVSGDKKFAPVLLSSDATKMPSFEWGGSSAVASTSRKARPAIVIKQINSPCWDTDYVSIDLDVQNSGRVETGADLLYANDINPEFQLGRRTHCKLAPTVGKQTLLFALRSLPEWSFGTSNARFKLMLPHGAEARLLAVKALLWTDLTPRIDFENSSYMGTKGYLHLGADKPQNKITVDASTVRGAASAEMEITRPNLLFEEQNSASYSSFAREHTPTKLKQTVILDKKDFPSPGIYELRAWAKDGTGKVIGLASDHIVIAVDP